MNQQPGQVRLSPAHQRAIGACPFQCQPSMVVQAHEHSPLGAVVRTFCRCQVCLASWWVDPEGVVSRLQQPATFTYCTSCLKPYRLEGMPVDQAPDIFCSCAQG